MAETTAGRRLPPPSPSQLPRPSAAVGGSRGPDFTSPANMASYHHPGPTMIPQRQARVVSGNALPGPSSRGRPAPPPTLTPGMAPCRTPSPVAPQSLRRRPRPPADPDLVHAEWLQQDGSAESAAPRSLRAPLTPRQVQPRLPPPTEPPRRTRATTTAPADKRSPNQEGTADMQPSAGIDCKDYLSAFLQRPHAVALAPHIRVRLRLLRQLGEVLSMDSQAVAALIDVNGLLARVDKAYERRQCMERVASAAPSGLPLPRPGAASAMRASRSGGMLGIIKRLGKKPSADVLSTPGLRRELDDGPVFGVALDDAPAGSWCTSLIGGQRHELPLVVFTVVEEVYRRGMSQPGIFRLAGDGARVGHLIKAFNLAPFYGDSLAIASEPVHNLAGLVKRYVRDLPHPLIDPALFAAFTRLCVETPTTGTLSPPAAAPPSNDHAAKHRVSAAQILLKLLPPATFSLVVYLLAFLGQLPLFPDNRLNVDSISIIFGPALCAARGVGIAGLGPGSGGAKTGAAEGAEAAPDADAVSNLVNESQSCLAWLLRNWGQISQNVLDPPEGDEAPAPQTLAAGPEPDARLLSPIDLRSRSDSLPKRHSMPPVFAFDQPGPVTLDKSPSTRKSLDERGRSAALEPAPSAASSAGSSRALKRSASFNSLSSLVKKGGELMARIDRRSPNMHSSRSFSDDKTTMMSPVSSPSPPISDETLVSTPPALPGKREPSITTVLGSLHDLLVSKDRQIERDARELALLRQTLLEMDSKLKDAAAATGPSPAPPHRARDDTPQITVTASASAKVVHDDIARLQTELSATLSSLNAANEQAVRAERRVRELQGELARTASERGVEVSRLEVELALERAMVVGLTEERDIARQRLDKVKTTLFAVS